ncbi:MAG: Glutamate 5-kinase (EC [uncultured Sulfurovum sp.]|uniref:Glutamate 5-kinase n=1 Tax=uncultured Sulfurovum sp. TaxID=269237 RepID=A0A6S6TB00_9BACT|nr:MAG: Glutamate 5-kinase (EC [uncultured Sulfurovum sp.]
MPYNRIVIKVGSHVLTENSEVARDRMREIVTLIVALMARGQDVILVSSGAVSAGYSKLPLEISNVDNKQVLASIGQAYLLKMYQEEFESHGMLCSQILLSTDELDSKKMTVLVKKAIDNLLLNGVVPIINENDVISIDELVFGDNDKLSAHVAHYFDAELLVLLSDIDAYYDKDPRVFEDAKAQLNVSTISKEALEAVVTNENEFRTGGIVSKLRAAQFMLEQNKEAFMSSGFDLHNVKSFLLDQKQVGGTFFKS